MKKMILLPIMAVAFLLMQGTSWAGYSAGMTICHCPPGKNGTKCFEITINSQGAYNGHFPNHAYDHSGACTAEESATSSNSNSNSNSSSSDPTTSTNLDVGSGTVDGFTVPKAGGSNWREQ